MSVHLIHADTFIFQVDFVVILQILYDTGKEGVESKLKNEIAEDFVCFCSLSMPTVHLNYLSVGKHVTLASITGDLLVSLFKCVVISSIVVTLSLVVVLMNAMSSYLSHQIVRRLITCYLQCFPKSGPPLH